MNVDILEYAMQMEKDGEAYYKDMAAKSSHEGVKQILLMLASDEVYHYEAFRSLMEKSYPGIGGSGILKKARTIFSEMRESKKDLNSISSGVELYREAIEIEKKSESYYSIKAEEAEDPQEKAILLKIAEDERKHKYLLENMVTFLSRPQKWIENSEFNHLDEY